MKRNISIVLLVVVVGAASFGLGRMSAQGFEFRVEVSPTGATLSSSDGCAWAQSTYSSNEGVYAFEVNESGVRTLGAITE